jgi:hypothetical protein
MSRSRRYTITFLCWVFSLTAFGQLKTENVILVTLDGFRWQEMFSGADEALLDQQKYLKDATLKEKFWRADPTERRRLLLPFFWNTVAVEGQLYGNRNAGSKVDVRNTMLFSYPGYNEILSGKADDVVINSNDKNYNPNETVLEFVNKQNAFKGKVAAFASWDVFPFIINDKRSEIFVSTGVAPVSGPNLTERERMMNDMIMRLPNPIAGIRLDAFTFYYGMEYLKKRRPRVMYFAFDETDDFAHQGEYAAYLNSAHHTDGFLAELWKFIQSDPKYRERTTLIITTDHGRGTTAETWKHHSKDYPEASQIWLAFLGPDTPPLGESKNNSQLHQDQVAATLAAFLGLRFDESGHGKVISSALRK